MKIVALTGAGISAPSGVATFRDLGGVWERHRIEDVATPEAWERNPALVLDFYNQRRAQLGQVRPNAAHQVIAAWQERHDVRVITQNVDDLHERAGSRNVLHLHGQLRQVRSTRNADWIKDVGYEPVKMGELCPQGGQLRPNIVWFGEAVPAMADAAELVKTADVLIVVGTSLQVYPAASLIDHASPNAQCFYVDPNPSFLPENFKIVRASAEIGVWEIDNLITNKTSDNPLVKNQAFKHP